jgi:hypothetical protein
MVEYILCYRGPAEHWGPLPATRLASREILIEQNIKSGQGQHSVYSVVKLLTLLRCPPPPSVAPPEVDGWGNTVVKNSCCPENTVYKLHLSSSS